MQAFNKKDTKELIAIVQNEPNEFVRRKVEQWVMVYSTDYSEIPDYSPLIGIAESSSVKNEILGWIDGVKDTPSESSLETQAENEDKNKEEIGKTGHVKGDGSTKVDAKAQKDKLKAVK